MAGMRPHRIAAALALTAFALAAAATPERLLSQYGAAAGAPGVPQRGQDFFTRTHGREGAGAPSQGGGLVRRAPPAAPAKPITPLAPAFDAQRFSDAAKVEKWFRRNCNDVVGR